jgi:nucleotide-binding universal stress UspA family protein
MFQRILVPLDESAQAERAIPVAARLARASGGSIVFVCVVIPPVEGGKYAVRQSDVWQRKAFEADRAKAITYLAGMIISHANELAGIEIEMGVASDIVPAGICSTARREHADLVVMCSYGETGLKRWIFGSVAQEVVRHSPVPVLVLHEHGAAFSGSRAAHPLRVLVALDGSPQSEAALEPTIELMAALTTPAQSTLHLLRVVDLPPANGKWRSQVYIDAMMLEQARQEAEAYLKAVAHRLHTGPLAALNLTVTSSVAISTDITSTIIKQAEQIDPPEYVGGCDLIVMTTHERRGLRRLVRGSSVPEHVLDSTRLPLLIVRPHETPTQAHFWTK